MSHSVVSAGEGEVRVHELNVDQPLERLLQVVVVLDVLLALFGVVAPSVFPFQLIPLLRVEELVESPQAVGLYLVLVGAAFELDRDLVAGVGDPDEVLEDQEVFTLLCEFFLAEAEGVAQSVVPPPGVTANSYELKQVLDTSKNVVDVGRDTFCEHAAERKDRILLIKGQAFIR